MSASTRNRPLSPHIQVYRWQLNSLTSILHRLSGVALAIGTLLATCWLLALASGAEAFMGLQNFLRSPFGLFLIFGWSAALFFHACSGIKHLLMDIGYFFSLPGQRRAGMAVFIAAAALLALVWCVV
jgi:succinate dehydrogenase / fumarate reductase, cytochrome b subunit